MDVTNVAANVGNRPCIGTVGPFNEFTLFAQPITQLSWPDVNYVGSAALLSRCEIKLLTEIKGTNCELGLAFAERKKTEKLLTGTMQSIKDDILLFKHRFPKDFKSMVLQGGFDPNSVRRSRYTVRATNKRPLTVREMKGIRVTDRWLEMQYGWSPLMSDLHGAMSSVGQRQNGNQFFFKKMSRLSGKSSAPNMFGGAGFNGSNWTVISDWDERVECAVWYKLNTSGLSAFSSLGLTNPVSIAWELVPWSFVVDWFLPLGNWFNTFDAGLGKTFYCGYKSRRARFGFTDKAYSVPIPTLGAPSVRLRYIDKDREYRYTSFDRTKYADFPSPSAPAFKNPCSPLHVANGLALLVGAMTRGR